MNTQTYKPLDKSLDELKKDLDFLKSEDLNSREQSERVAEYAKSQGSRAPLMFEVTEGYSYALGLIGMGEKQITLVATLSAVFTRNIMAANDGAISKEEIISKSLKSIKLVEDENLEAEID